MKKISNMLILAVLAIGMGLTSCEGVLDDILGEWSRPTPGTPSKNPSEKPESPASPQATPLTLEAITDGTITVENPKPSMKFSLNGGAKSAVTTNPIDVYAGDKVQFYGAETQYSDGMTSTIFGGTAQVKVYGNIMSLLDETGYETKTDLPNESFVFCSLFKSNAKLTDASGLLLPAETLTDNCYSGMFQNCTALTAAPKLPAETLAEGCYNSMFYGCTSLTTAPELKAETLAWQCYSHMFASCTALTTAPELKAETLAEECCSHMFQGCTSLTTAPELKVKTLAVSCYYGMFEGCTSLTKAYVKAAFTDYYFECSDMFKGCTATGAKLHTTSGNKSSWEGVMGSGKTWETWEAVDDWN